jgi:hypothetical protein
LYPSVVKMATRKLVRYYVANSYDCSWRSFMVYSDGLSLSCCWKLPDNGISGHRFLCNDLPEISGWLLCTHPYQTHCWSWRN